MDGDPQAVRRAAQRVAESADEMRVDAHRAAAAAGVARVGVRAGRYRDQLAESVALAGRLDVDCARSGLPVNPTYEELEQRFGPRPTATP